MSNPVTAIQKYYGETVEQLKKCSWPARGELYESTILVVAFMVLLTLFVFFADKFCEILVRYVTIGL